MLKQQTNNRRLRILLTASEAVPWSKTGGLADVSTALGKALASAGHDVTLIVPYHRGTPFAQENALSVHQTGTTVTVPLGAHKVSGSVCWAETPNSQLRLLLIDQPDYFDRPSLYHDKHGDYHDNLERFVFFSRAVLEVAHKLVLRPDVIHVNDWQTGLIPALLEIERRGTPGFEQTKSVLTIHNLAFQGWFPSSGMVTTNVSWEYFNWQQMECHDQLNLLKTGIAFSDQLTTVSPSYAKEIQTVEFGCGLHELLASRQHDLVGILNGIDPDEWSPQHDKFISPNFNIEDYASQKPKCKAHLQQRMGLPPRTDVPLFGMVSRMTDQKGLDLITEVAEPLLSEDVQIAFLGSGDERYEAMIGEMASRQSSKVAAKIGFDEALAHEIEAAADFYLMPSRFEPCGLNQMYSLAYGTIPLVRAVGGLADSVVDVTDKTLADGTATGIAFHEYTSLEFLKAFHRCLQLYRKPELLHQVVRSGMQCDFSWDRSAEKYVSVYHKVLATAENHPSNPQKHSN